MHADSTAVSRQVRASVIVITAEGVLRSKRLGSRRGSFVVIEIAEFRRPVRDFDPRGEAWPADRSVSTEPARESSSSSLLQGKSPR